MKELLFIICFIIWGGDMMVRDTVNPLVPIATMVFMAGAIDKAVADVQSDSIVAEQDTSGAE